MGKGVSSMENMPVVNLGHARKAFGSNEVLKDISLTVNQGDVLSIIGPFALHDAARNAGCWFACIW